MEKEEKDICDKYKAKENKSYIIACKILEAIFERNDVDKQIEASEFSSSEYFRKNKETVSKILEEFKYVQKESLRVLKCLKLLNNANKKYTLSLKDWIKDTNYEITDNKILEEIVPVLIGYISKIPGVKVNDFFKKLDSILRYGIKPSLEHNQSPYVEEYIIEAIENFEDIIIYKKDTKKQIVIESDPIEIIYEEVDGKSVKVLTYKDTKLCDNEIYKILLSDIVKIASAEINSAKINTGVSAHEGNSTFFTYNPNYLINSEDDIKKSNSSMYVLLEVDTVVSEYVEMKPLQQMTIYRTKKEKDLFFKKYEYQPLKNKLYIEASDDKEYVIDYIFKNIQYVKIIQPSSLKVEIQDRFNTYLANSGKLPKSSNAKKPETEVDSSPENEDKKEVKPKLHGPRKKPKDDNDKPDGFELSF